MQRVLGDIDGEVVARSGLLYCHGVVRHIVSDSPQPVCLHGADFRLCVACIEGAGIGRIVVGEDADGGRVAVVDKDVEDRMVEKDISVTVKSQRSPPMGVTLGISQKFPGSTTGLGAKNLSPSLVQ